MGALWPLGPGVVSHAQCDHFAAKWNFEIYLYVINMTYRPPFWLFHRSFHSSDLAPAAGNPFGRQKRFAVVEVASKFEVAPQSSAADLKFLNELATTGVGTSNRRH